METDINPLRIADLDNDDKPREKAISQGIDRLTNAELLAIILGSGMRGMSVIELSRQILKSNDNKLSRLSRMSVHELVTKYKGIGTAKAISLLASIELGTRCVNSMAVDSDDPRIRQSRDIYNYMKQRLERKPHEEFWVMFLNTAGRVQAAEIIGQGGIASTTVDIKLILKKALDKLSSSIALVHNHPSGNLTPSIQDDNLTHKISEAAKTIDLKVIDHLIISSSGYYSYNDEGRL